MNVPVSLSQTLVYHVDTSLLAGDTKTFLSLKKKSHSEQVGKGA